ncbi:MAG TPA: hypothetical protein PKI41_06740 [Candidatus Competibacteraceae bacterium]|nr:hypothetical protein [Candidatus Competibacteraceae bacterium]HQA27035.1 hypothetical protein [Candidatus Competibacteraceae bacterium]HQD56407.1 hypothetical protein [Candidatus Competibacteraceae bacterium]
MNETNATMEAVLNCGDLDSGQLAALLQHYGLYLVHIAPANAIPGSYWGDREAGLIGDRLFVRADTPVHSALHEACHYICMDAERRTRLHTDAGGEVIEENGVCYLQILLADELPEVGRVRMCADMDAWGYTFRLGSARAWFERDAEDARCWLRHNGLIDHAQRPRWRLRQA